MRGPRRRPPAATARRFGNRTPTARRSNGPVRTCVGCRRPRPQDELVRLVRGRDGMVVVDAARTAPGRGAYVCGDETCARRGLSPERLAHVLRAPCRVPVSLAAAVQAVASARDAEARGR